MQKLHPFFIFACNSYLIFCSLYWRMIDAMFLLFLFLKSSSLIISQMIPSNQQTLLYGGKTEKKTMVGLLLFCWSEFKEFQFRKLLIISFFFVGCSINMSCPAFKMNVVHHIFIYINIFSPGLTSLVYICFFIWTMALT